MYENQKKLRGSALIEHTHKSTELALGTLLCLEGVFAVMSNKMDEGDSIDPSEIPDDCPEDLVFDVEDDIIHRAIIDWTPTSNMMKNVLTRWPDADEIEQKKMCNMLTQHIPSLETICVLRGFMEVSANALIHFEPDNETMQKVKALQLSMIDLDRYIISNCHS
jgi:hypothetical protein